jgi:hypothetical protein
LLHRTLPAAAVRAGMTAALTTGSANPAVVAIEARRSTETAQSPVVPIGQGLSRSDRPKPSVTHYDQPLEGTR